MGNFSVRGKGKDAGKRSDFCTLPGMHFKEYCDSIADKLEAQLKGYSHSDLNPADKGELCEVFIKEVIEESLGDMYRIFRGGKVISSGGAISKQLDVVICSRQAIKFYSNKGKYPTETVKGVFSITSTLDLPKLEDCLAEFASIPKKGYHFISPKDLYPEKFKIETQRIFENLTPVCCVFAYHGNIQPSWLAHLRQWIDINKPNPSLMPTFIIVNKKGMIFRRVLKVAEDGCAYSFHYIDFTDTGHPGEAFSRILNDLYNLAKEDQYMQPDYTYYFNADQDSIKMENSQG
jgi:hypothetical protein